MLKKKTGLLALISAAALVVAACSSVNIDAPRGVDNKRQWDGAGAQ